MSNRNSRLSKLEKNFRSRSKQCQQAEALRLHMLVDEGCPLGAITCFDCNMAESNMKQWIAGVLPNEVKACSV